MKIVIAGEMPLVDEIGQICTRYGHDTVLYLVEDFPSAIQSGWAMPDAAGADVAIELHNESAPAKEELLVSLAASTPPNAILFTSALATSTTKLLLGCLILNVWLGLVLFLRSNGKVWWSWLLVYAHLTRLWKKQRIWLRRLDKRPLLLKMGLDWYVCVTVLLFNQ